MLELKRKAGECVVVGDSLQLTVLELDAPIVRVRIDTPSMTASAPLTVGRTYEAHVDGQPVKLQIARIERGEVSLRFDAPRQLRIDRWERAV